MQIVIDISENDYNELRTAWKSFNDTHVGRLLKAIYDGQQLPKGHGDLKDTDGLKHAFIMWSMAVQGNFTNADIASIIYNSPTIIEADKEVEDRNDD